MNDFDANKDIHWWDIYLMSIMVCNLEVPMCYREYRKASKSVWRDNGVYKSSTAPNYPVGPIRVWVVSFFVVVVVLGTTSRLVN